jgi:hypothetical protein
VSGNGISVQCGGSLFKPIISGFSQSGTCAVVIVVTKQITTKTVPIDAHLIKLIETSFFEIA